MNKQLQEIKNLLKDSIGTAVKVYLAERPNQIPAVSLPMIYVYPVSDEMEIEDTRDDLHRLTFRVGVAVMKDPSTNLSEWISDKKKLYTLFQGDDAAGDIITGSVVGTLRKRDQALNITGGISLETNPARIDYDASPEGLETEKVLVREGEFVLTYVDNVISTQVTTVPPVATNPVPTLYSWSRYERTLTSGEANSLNTTGLDLTSITWSNQYNVRGETSFSYLNTIVPALIHRQGVITHLSEYTYSSGTITYSANYWQAGDRLTILA